MGGGTTTTNEFDTRVTDIPSQFGIGQNQWQDVGQQLLGGSMQGFDALRNMSMGNFGGLGGGGGGGGGVGGIMGLGKYGQALGNDVFSDEFSQKLLSQALRGIQSGRERAGMMGSQMAQSAGISRDSPAFLRFQERIGRGVEEREAGTRQDVFLKQAMEQLQNQRLQAQHETQLRGVSRAAQGTERAARTGARASSYNARLNAMLQSAGAIGTGGAMRGFGQPFDVSHLNTEQKTTKQLGLMDYLGAGTGIAGMAMGMPGMPGMGGKGAGAAGAGPGGSTSIGGGRYAL